MTTEQAVEKAKELVGSSQTFIMATVDADNKPQIRWMGALAPDPADEKVRYLVCGTQSRKMEQIAANPATQLMFSSSDYSCIVTLSGSCEPVQDAQTKQAVWEAVPGLTQYFQSVDDPNYAVLRFTICCLEVLCMGEAHEPVRVDLCD